MRLSVEIPLSLVAFASIEDVKLVFEVILLCRLFVQFIDVELS
jgi:hypothetical protein